MPKRQTPELRFEVDTSVDAGMRMSEALSDVPPTLAARREAGEDEVADSGMGVGGATAAVADEAGDEE